MQLTGPVALGLLWAMGASSVLGACTVAVGTPGLLALSADGTQLGSDLGVASVMTISNINLLGSTITLSNPRLDGSSPNLPGAIVEEAYSATWLLGLGQSSGGYTSSGHSFTVPGVANLVVTIVLNNRVTSAGGFMQGNYQTRTTVDCT